MTHHQQLQGTRAHENASGAMVMILGVPVWVHSHCITKPELLLPPPTNSLSMAMK
jgi:hypothetical protein